MKFYLLSDNVDTLMGMRLAGIDGIVIHTEKEVRTHLDEAMKRSDVAVVLMTHTLMELCPEHVMNYKLNVRRPLIVEIPDRHGNGATGETITKYVRDAIGVKME
ncbi:MAG: V-type ATP synthase subunit F [Clostridia bacterium]|nr:V-type ATP synthase subunit F [Clostridia bacterium]